MGDIKEADVREALERLDPLWMNSSPPSRRASCICWWSGLMSPSWSFHDPIPDFMPQELLLERQTTVHDAWVCRRA